MRKIDETALRKSIAHWERIEAGEEEERGCDNCELCQLDDRRTDRNDNLIPCEKCVIFKKTKLGECGTTPFWAWRSHHRQEHLGRPHTVLCPTCKKLAHDEVEFLKSLLPEKP